MAPSKSFVSQIYLLSCGFFAVFVSFNTVQSLETTLVEKKLADVALGTLYAVFTIAAIIAPRIVDLIGPRLSMVVGALPYGLVCLSNLDPSYYLTVPAFGLVGFGAAILWTAQGVYLGRCAIQHARATGENEDAVTSRFNGIFFASFQFNGFIGSLVAAIAFTGGSESATTKRVVFISFACCAFIGTAILSFLRTMDSSAGKPSATAPDVKLEQDDMAAPAPISLLETLQLFFRSGRMTLIAIAILYNGMSLGFFFSDYPSFYSDDKKKHIVRLMPSARVGFVVAAFYAVNSLASYVWGRMVPRIGRRGTMTMATIIHIVFYVVLLVCNTKSVFKHFTHGSAGAYFIAFGLSVVFAIGDAVWESQLPAVLQSSSYFGRERDREAAMSNLKMWQSLGFAIQFVFGFVIDDLRVKIVILLALMVVSAAALAYIHTRIVSLDSQGRVQVDASALMPMDDEDGITADPHKPLLSD